MTTPLVANERDTNDWSIWEGDEYVGRAFSPEYVRLFTQAPLLLTALETIAASHKTVEGCTCSACGAVATARTALEAFRGEASS